MMTWEDYIGENLAVPADTDRARLERMIGARLPDACWDLVRRHQGQALDAEAIEVPGQGAAKMPARQLG